ncbi:cellulose binding domain-containing protein [Actinocrinis sp.]|uniref:cellulose binding domain-containing protein n=1 Tax=Actinocrinis sp. TaxID=1920516 RepID=UPI002D648B71|nr:cellulose binding domain-containing protein [Actinocrinis sp.]HZP51281.1 cellulose binding domain-containing protein [Actinocrinis sp.]
MRRIPGRATLAVATVTCVIGATALATRAPAAYAASTATINGASVLQQIDGFGFSSAFARAETIQALSAANQKQALDLLFSPTTGAGLDILRLGISSTSSSIEPNNPGGPSAPPQYVWNGNDDGQVWLAKQAQSYGVSRFYANPWSAPGYMKDSGSEANGGTLCGLSGTSCASGDWRTAYADYLIQYTKFYAQEGVKITDLAFTNEPNFTATYSSMRFTPAQAVEFAKILGPLAHAAGLNLTCCDAVGWSSQLGYTQAITADPVANQDVDIHTGHSYGSNPTSPLPAGGKHVWMSEWAPSGSAWNGNWDDSTSYDGFAIAQHIQTSLTQGDVNGYLYWYGISTGATQAFLQGNGTTYQVSKRLWAMANFSRFIRPGANRIGSTSSDGNIQLSAYRNADGSIIVVALNSNSADTPVTYSLQNTGFTAGTATPYLTNSASSTAAQAPISVGGGAFSVTVPARSLVTYVIRGGSGGSPSASASASPSPSASSSPSSSPSASPSASSTGSGAGACKVSDTVSAWNTGLTENITVTNTGSTAVNGWKLGFTLPSGQTVTSSWNATISPSSGAVTATNVSYNAAIPPGGSTSFGFQANHTGNAAPPAGFTLNGAACASG